MAAKPGASEAARKTEVELQVALGYQYQNAGTANEKAIAVLQAAMAKAAEYGGKDPQKNLYMAERYGEAGGWLTTTLIGQGRLEEANRVGRDAEQVTEAVLQMRPGAFSALYSLGLIEGYLGAAAKEDLRPADALPFYARATEVYTTITRLDPGNRIYANNRASQYWDMSGALWSLRRTRESLEALTVTVEGMKLAGTGGASLFLSYLARCSCSATSMQTWAISRRQSGIHGELEQLVTEFRASQPPNDVLVHFAAAQSQYLGISIARLQGNWQEARRLAEQIVNDVRDLPAGEGVQRFWKFGALSGGSDRAAEAQNRTGRFQGGRAKRREGYAAQKSQSR